VSNLDTRQRNQKINKKIPSARSRHSAKESGNKTPPPSSLPHYLPPLSRTPRAAPPPPLLPSPRTRRAAPSPAPFSPHEPRGPSPPGQMSTATSTEPRRRAAPAPVLLSLDPPELNAGGPAKGTDSGGRASFSSFPLSREAPVLVRRNSWRGTSASSAPSTGAGGSFLPPPGSALPRPDLLLCLPCGAPLRALRRGGWLNRRRADPPSLPPPCV